MERKCKMGGEGVRNRDVVKEDMISELPEALLLHILYLVPTETAIVTSVLSKRWKSLWKMIPNLMFDSEYHHAFSENVCRSLILHQAPVLESLYLVVRYECDPVDMVVWIAIAFSRKVRKLVMKLEEEEDGFRQVIFPDIVLRYNNKLEILKLKGPMRFDLTSPVCLNYLRELHLFHVNFDDEESVSNLLCGCPRLQVFVLRQLSWIGVDTFTIAVASLQRLSIIIDDCNPDDAGYVINAPSLKYLYINGLYGLDFCLIENAPELEEVKITEVSKLSNENFLESLVSAERLSLCLSPLTIKYPVGKIFYQLLSLELCTEPEEWWNLLSLMLDSSPKLQILKLIDGCLGFAKDCPKWNQPECVPECLLFHLETFVWTSYNWEGEVDKEVATYILKNAIHLKKATFSTSPIDLSELEKRNEILNQLSTEVRASNSCDLVFKSEAYSYHCSHEDVDFDE